MMTMNKKIAGCDDSIDLCYVRGKISNKTNTLLRLKMDERVTTQLSCNSTAWGDWNTPMGHKVPDNYYWEAFSMLLFTDTLGNRCNTGAKSDT
jgi:hypothetical protein